MTLPLDPTAELAGSEYSHGAGMFPHPDNDFQAGKTPFPEEDDIAQDFRDTVAIRRSDPTVGDETIRDLLFAKGNPDRFGGQQPLVREAIRDKTKTVVTPDIKDRVTRED